MLYEPLYGGFEMASPAWFAVKIAGVPNSDGEFAVVAADMGY